ncbi:hypothetical protein ERJ75_000370300 [Trypanosoma vivax]|nr:hypothetical protein ERJ75_000370300 [Trypanosoma vivax]
MAQSRTPVPRSALPLAAGAPAPAATKKRSRQPKAARCARVARLEPNSATRSPPQRPYLCRTRSATGPTQRCARTVFAAAAGRKRRAEPAAGRKGDKPSTRFSGGRRDSAQKRRRTEGAHARREHRCRCAAAAGRRATRSCDGVGGSRGAGVAATGTKWETLKASPARTDSPCSLSDDAGVSVSTPGAVGQAAGRASGRGGTERRRGTA